MGVGRAGENALVERFGFGAFAPVLVEIGEVEQGGNVGGVRGERGPEFTLRLGWPAQDVPGADDPAVEMDLLGAGDAVLEGLGVGGESLDVAAGAAL
ncbi:MAG: hypothetical protein U1E87_07115 [Alphaproteobacteria bacterium]